MSAKWISCLLLGDVDINIAVLDHKHLVDELLLA